MERYWTVTAVTVIRFYNSIYFIRLANSIAIIFISRNFRESSNKLGKEAGTNLVLLSRSKDLVIHWKLICTDQIRFYNFLRSRKLSNVQLTSKYFSTFNNMSSTCCVPQFSYMLFLSVLKVHEETKVRRNLSFSGLWQLNQVFCLQKEQACFQIFGFRS